MLFRSRRDHAGHAQSGNQRGRLTMAVRVAHPQPLAPAATAVAACHVGRCPRFIDEDQPLGIEIELPLEPGLALDQNVGAVLPLGMRGLYGMARPSSSGAVWRRIRRRGPMTKTPIVTLGINLARTAAAWQEWTRAAR